MKTKFVQLNNWQVKKRKIKVRLDQILVLLPRCLQFHACPQDLVTDPHNCKKCGKCNIADLVTLCDELGVHISLATGGGAAVKMAKDPNIKAIIAIACDKELALGILFTMPKPVLAVPNILTHGPCYDTQVDIGKVRDAIEQLTQPDN